MFDLIEIEALKNILLEDKNSRLNFPKKISFPFPEVYKNLVTQIRTTEISSECILFGSVESINQSNEFYKVDYWSRGFEIEKIKNYWFFGANGQGDLWILHRKNKVFFYDHNCDAISESNLTDLNLSFEKWLQFAFLNKQLESVSYKKELTNDLKNVYKSKLLELSAELKNDYPFEI